MRWPLLLVTFLALGCDRLDAELPSLSLPASRATLDGDSSKASRRGVGVLPESRNRIRTAVLKLRQRLTFSPAGQTLPSCQGRLLAKEPLSLVFSYTDTRTTTRSLLSRRVSERLESGDTTELFRDSEALETKSEEELKKIEASLQSWEKRRYVGVFFISEYQGPALILRVGALKRSWYPGNLSAQFALVDTLEQKAICGYNLRVENDTREAPIRSRLQAETRARLERELGRSLFDAATAQLQRDVTGLKLPETLALSSIR